MKKYRLRISFDLPSETDPKVVSEVIHKTFAVAKKLTQGDIDFKLAPWEGSRLSLLLDFTSAPPSIDVLKIRLPELEHLEISDASVN